MEENLHEDKMDDYVRKSFEEYEVSPPSDMWNRVSANLEDAPERMPLWLTFRKMGWQLLAAGVILVLSSTLVCEHLYYESQLLELTHATQTDGVMNSQTSTSMEGASSTPDRQTPETTQIPIALHSPLPVQHATSGATNKQPQFYPSQPVDQMIQQSLQQGAATENPTSGEAMVVDAVQQETAKQLNRINCENIQIPLNSLQQIAPSLPALVASPLASQPIIHPKKGQTGWYAGVETSIMCRLEKAQTVAPRPGRPVFTSEATGSPITSIYWLKVGKQWQNHWSLESGLGHQQTNRTAIHRPTFRFGDGTHMGTGPRRNFNYDLNTSNGTAEVSLRMEQTQPGNPSDDEPVNLRIETEESTQWIRVPVLLGYQWGERRLKGFVQTGLLANMVVRNQLNIAARVSENARFKPVDGQDGYTINLTQKRFVPGYWLGAGLGYQVGQHLLIQAEACLSGDFPRNDLYRRRLPERYQAGVNLGLSYYF